MLILTNFVVVFKNFHLIIQNNDAKVTGKSLYDQDSYQGIILNKEMLCIGTVEGGVVRSGLGVGMDFDQVNIESGRVSLYQNRKNQEVVVKAGGAYRLVLVRKNNRVVFQGFIYSNFGVGASLTIFLNNLKRIELTRMGGNWFYIVCKKRQNIFKALLNIQTKKIFGNL